MLKHNVIVHINKTDKTISYEKIDYEENSINLDSKEGIEVLDEWYYKWVGLFRNIYKSHHLTFDLSGGFDSRVIAALWLSANINLDNLTINSSHHHERFNEDFEIASSIANHFNFKLNQAFKRKKIPYTLDDSINVPSYVKFGFHKKRYYPLYKNTYPNYRVSGHCGGTIRNYPNMPINKYVENIIKKSEDYDNQIMLSTKKLFKQKTLELSEIYSLNKDSKRLSSILYRESRNRHHFGKAFVEAYLKNWITLAPLSDSLLSKLKITTKKCNDDLLIITLILVRFCPDLLNFKVEGNREFNTETIEYAKKLNEKYSLEDMDLKFIAESETKQEIVNDNAILKLGEHALLFKDIFNSKNFIKDYEKYFSKQSYKFIRKTIYKDTHYLQDVHAAIDILKINEYIEFNKNLNYKSIGSWFKSYPIVLNDEFEIDKLLDKYRTLRIDIINKGSIDNDFELLDYSDTNLKHKTPDWFNKPEGVGHVFKTHKSNLFLKFKIIKNGKLNIGIKSENIKDVNGNPFPVYVDCFNFEVNNVSIIDEHTLITRDGFNFNKDVNNGDIISIKVNWLPFNDSSVYNLVNVNSPNKENKKLKKKSKNVDENKIFNFGNLVKKFKN